MRMPDPQRRAFREAVCEERAGAAAGAGARMFPAATPSLFFMTATTDVASAGRAVPTATKESPITAGGIAKISAISKAPDRSRWAPRKTITRPVTVWMR